MDNATVNDALLRHLQTELAVRGNTDFDAENNFIRCFSHIINLCAQAVIKGMQKDDAAPIYSDTETEDSTASDNSDAAPTQTIGRRTTRKAGPILRARKTVGFIRKSGQRRDQLIAIIERGNATKQWSQISDDGSKVVTILKPVVLLPDVKTRWDSVFYMLQRLRYLREVGVPISVCICADILFSPFNNFSVLIGTRGVSSMRSRTTIGSALN